MIKLKQHARVPLSILRPVQIQQHLHWLIASKINTPLCFQHPSDSLLFWVGYQILLPELGQSLGTHGWTGCQVSVYLAQFGLGSPHP
jgi:hypothetical protein